MPVVISGSRQTVAALRKVQPEAAKSLTKKLKQAAKPLVSKARGFAPTEAPLSGWSHAVGMWSKRVYMPSQVRSGIGFSSSGTKPNYKGFSYTSYLFNKSAAGAIYETAGRKSGMDGRPIAPSVQHYANAGTPLARADYKVRNSDKRYSQSANPNAGRQFMEAMGVMKDAAPTGGRGRHTRKMKGRLIFRAAAEDQGKVYGAVVKAYSEVINNFNRGAL